MDPATERASQLAAAKAMRSDFQKSGTFHANGNQGRVRKRTPVRRQQSGAVNGAHQGALQPNQRLRNSALTPPRHIGALQPSYQPVSTPRLGQGQATAVNRNICPAPTVRPAPAIHNPFSPGQTNRGASQSPTVTRPHVAATGVRASGLPFGAMAAGKAPAQVQGAQLSPRSPVVFNTQPTVSGGTTTACPVNMETSAAGVTSAPTVATPITPVIQVTSPPQATIDDLWKMASSATDEAGFGFENADFGFGPAPATSAISLGQASVAAPANAPAAVASPNPTSNGGLLGSRHAATDNTATAAPRQPSQNVVPAIPAGQRLVWNYQAADAKPEFRPIEPVPEMSDEMDLDEPFQQPKNSFFKPTLTQHHQNPHDCTCVGLQIPSKGLGTSRWASPDRGEVVNTGNFTYAGGNATGTCPIHDHKTQHDVEFRFRGYRGHH